ncbi:hypothetical protein GCM10008903_25480 [Clostridium cadaveris]
MNLNMNLNNIQIFIREILKHSEDFLIYVCFYYILSICILNRKIIHI